MKIKIICVGKLKESFYRDACGEYLKRLGRYASVEIIEVKDEPAGEGLSDRQIEIIKDTEGKRILKKLSPSDRVYCLDIQGKSFSSEGFSDLIENDMNTSKDICFVIGGSLGLSPRVLNGAFCRISFSKLTFPHQLMRVILLEQIYRGFRIMRNEPYHK